MTSKTQSTDI